MKTSHFFLLVLVTFLAASCSKNIHVTYQPQKSNTSQIVLKYDKVSHRTRILMNDKLIVNGAQAKSVTINNVPAGDYTIKCSSSSGWRKDRVHVAMGVKLDGVDKTVIKKVDMPIQNGWYWVGVSSLVVWPLVLIAGYTL